MSTIATDRTHLTRHAELCVRRNGIAFHNLAPDQVLIEVEVENHGAELSRPSELVLEAAPLGAFVRWQPLTTVRVPAIAPGRSAWVRTVASQPRPGPVRGLFDDLPPIPRKGTASGEAREPRRVVRPDVQGLQRLMLGQVIGALPASLLDLVGPQPHWAGNLNVWIARRPVERHMAPRLRVHPGRANLALFFLGDGPDGYAFRTECSDDVWTCALHDFLTRRPVPCTEDPYRDPRWHTVTGPSVVLLVVRPPEFCARGKVDVHVTQRSTGKVATVEFDLDPSADGPGCFSV